MDSSPLNGLPPETLHQIFGCLPLRHIAAAKCICRALRSTLSSPSFLHLLRSHHPDHSLTVLALTPSHRHATSGPAALHAFDPASSQWLRFSLSFLPFSSLNPITSSRGLLYLWASHAHNPQKSLVVCNPLTCQFKILPQLGSAWSRHGSVLVGSFSAAIVLTGLAVLYYPTDGSFNPNWLKFSSNLPSKPRSPILISDSIFTICDLGSPWRPQWAMFKASIVGVEKAMQWVRLDKREWGDIFHILKRPRLVKSGSDFKLFMVGGLRSSHGLQGDCSTILILSLDLHSLEWEEVGRMPVEMYRCFADSSKFKVFGGENRLCFSSKRVGRLALWEEKCDGKAEWIWVDDGPSSVDGFCRGFSFEARLDAVP